MRKDPGGNWGSMANAGGEGRLRGEWGCMFKSEVLIIWNCQFHAPCHLFLHADLGPIRLFPLKSIFHLTIRFGSHMPGKRLFGIIFFYFSRGGPPDPPPQAFVVRMVGLHPPFPKFLTTAPAKIQACSLVRDGF